MVTFEKISCNFLFLLVCIFTNVTFSNTAHIFSCEFSALTPGYPLWRAPWHRPPGAGTNHKSQRLDGRVGVPSSLSSLAWVLGNWSGENGAEPMGAVARQRAWSAREREPYKRRREPAATRLCPLAPEQLGGLSADRLVLLRFISSGSNNMVRTKADSVPSTYRKGTVAVTRGRGVQEGSRAPGSPWRSGRWPLPRPTRGVLRLAPCALVAP